MSHRYQFPGAELQTARILAVAQRMQDQMDLNWITISHNFDHHGCGEETGDVDNTAAVTNTGWQYRVATVTWYLPAVASMTDYKLEEVVTHEFTHILLGPMKDHYGKSAAATEHEEFAVECVSRSLLAMRAAGENKRASA